MNANILHRDISPFNILIYDPPDGTKSVGILADWDLAEEERSLGVVSQSRCVSPVVDLSFETAFSDF